MKHFDLRLLKSYDDARIDRDTRLAYQLYLWSLTLLNFKALARKYL